MKRILCLWLPNWPIQRLIVTRPNLLGEPIVLYARVPRRGQCVSACSPEAGQAGVRLGMPLTESTALLRRIGRRPAALHIEPHDREADLRLLRQLVQWCQRFSPIVGMEEGETPESLLLDLQGLGKLLGDEQQFARNLAAQFQSQGYAIRIAIADTVGVAWGVAHFAQYDSGLGPSQSRPSTSSVVIVNQPAENLRAIVPLPIESLRLPSTTISLLHSLGIERVEQLMRLPRAGLATRFGPVVLRRLDQALGSILEPVTAYRTPPEFQATQALEYATDNQDLIRQVVRQLLEQITRQLKARQRGVMRLDCRFECLDSDPVQLRIDLFRPTAGASHLWELIEMQLEQRTLTGPILQVELQAVLTAQLEYEQTELFNRNSISTRVSIRRAARTPNGGVGGKTCSLPFLIDRLSSRLGQQAIVRAKLQSDSQPERAYSYLPIVGKELHRHHQANLEADRPSRVMRPLCLFPKPISIQISPSNSSLDRPTCWRWEGREYQVVRCWGPERIETGWWRGGSVCRDYFRVQTVLGQRFWLFRDLRDGNWFLQGAYE